MDKVHCSACGADSVPVPPSTRWKIASVALFLAMVGLGAVSGAIIALNIVLLPIWLMAATSIGTVSRRAMSWTCSECTAKLTPPVVTTPEPRPSFGAVPQPA